MHLTLFPASSSNLPDRSPTSSYSPALGDIAKVPAPVTEWCVIGACMIVMAALVISALIILGFVLAQTQLPPEIGTNQAELKTAGITG